MKIGHLLLLGSCSIALTACYEEGTGSDLSSKDLDTSIIRADMVVEATSDTKVSIYANLVSTIGSQRDVVLQAGDDFFASNNITSQEVDLNTLPSRNTYSESLTYYATMNQGLGGTVYTLSLDRRTPPDTSDINFPEENIEHPDFGEFYVAAPNSWVELPIGFDMTNESESTFHDESETVSISWFPFNTDDEMYLEYYTSCANQNEGLPDLVYESRRGISGDPGAADFAIGDFITTPMVNLNCNIALTLVRETSGFPDSELSPASSIEARQKRTLSIKYNSF